MVDSKKKNTAAAKTAVKNAVDTADRKTDARTEKNDAKTAGRTADAKPADADAKASGTKLAADAKIADAAQKSGSKNDQAVVAEKNKNADTKAKDADIKADAKTASDDAEFDEIEVEEEVETEQEVEVVDEKTGKKSKKTVLVKKLVKTTKKVARKPKIEEKPVELREPDSVFIDHGAVLPEFIPGTHLFALIRDPGTLYVYWNSEVESVNGWRLTAFDNQGNILQSFTTSHRRGGRGYFHIPTILAARVTLEKVEADGSVGMTLESTIKIAQQSMHTQAEKWVDVQDQHTVYEAPSSGHAPDYDAARAQHSLINNAIAGGGKEAMINAVPDGLRPGMNPSSWFGPLRAPGSSDLLPGSSDKLFRR